MNLHKHPDSTDKILLLIFVSPRIRGFRRTRRSNKHLLVFTSSSEKVCFSQAEKEFGVEKAKYVIDLSMSRTQKHDIRR